MAAKSNNSSCFKKKKKKKAHKVTWKFLLCVVFGRLLRLDGFHGGNGHIKYLSNCLQHAVSATDSLLINVENCSLRSASAGHQYSIYFQLSLSFFPPLV